MLYILCQYIGVVDCNERGENILHQDDLFRTHLEWPSNIFWVGSYFSECPVMRRNICNRENRVTPLIPLLQVNIFFLKMYLIQQFDSWTAHTQIKYGFLTTCK